ncbi:MAG: CD1375 family protein [Oscillospiraceae bacterium]
MAQVYADLIQKGVKTIADVPAKLKVAVEAILASRDSPADKPIA